MESVVNITIGSHLTMSRLFLDGNNGTAQYGLRAFKVSGAQARIEQVAAATGTWCLPAAAAP